MFEYIRKNLDNEIGKAFADSFLKLESDNGTQANIPFELKKMVNDLFTEMVREEDLYIFSFSTEFLNNLTLDVIHVVGGEENRCNYGISKKCLCI